MAVNTTTSMNVRDWPVEERPRERLLQDGCGSLSNTELLAVMLRTGTTGMDAVQLARALLARFGSLSSLLDADCKSFCSMPGLGPARYAQLAAARELVRRSLFEQVRDLDQIENPTQTCSYLGARMQDLEREVFACLFLDSRNRVIRYEELFFGTIDSAHVHPREVVKRALELNAAAVILAHNHPSGETRPSRADHEITQQLQQTLALVDIRVLDHIIVGRGKTTSFANDGLL